MEERLQQLLDIVDNDPKLSEICVDAVFLEKQISKLRELPFIQIHPKNPSRQKATPAAKLYKECMQQYTSIIRILISATNTDDSNEESPLRIWMRQQMENKS